MQLRLSEELFLLALDGNGRPAANGQRLDVAIAGGWLLDLALLERIEVPDKKVNVLSAAPVGHPELDAVLDTLGGYGRRKAQRWVMGLRRDARYTTGKHLHGQGVVQLAEREILGIFPFRRYHLTGAWSPETSRARLEQVVAGAEDDKRLVSLLALIHAAKLNRELLPSVGRREVRRRLRELEQDDWTGEAVRRAVQGIEGAIGAAAAAGGGGGGDGGGGGG